MKPFDLVRGSRTPLECPREHEVFEALALEGTLTSSPELRAHVDECAICRDVAAVAQPLLQENRVAVERAQPPTSGVVWWRAQMRARQEATQAATRPITVVQGVALSAFVAVFAAVMGVLAPRLLAWFAGIGLPMPEMSLGLPQIELTSLMPSTTTGMLLAGVGLLVLLLGPLAAYFAFGDE